MEIKPVLIVEHCTTGLKPIKESANQKSYILSGVFTEFNIKNRNDRIYTADKFLPHVNDLLERKKSLGVIYGEFDHPDVFDTSLARVSHTIESISYNKEFNRVDGEIRLLTTHWGKEARSLIDDDCPIFVSSRAAGITESDNSVTVKKLFTYDCVADPGFSSARMEIKSLNESLGFNESSNFRIYDMSKDTKTNELFEMNTNDVVTKKEMIEYSEYLAEELNTIKGYLNENSNGGVDTEKYQKMAELYENLQIQHAKVTEYLDYLAENISVIVNENENLKETTSKLIEHNNYIAEQLEKSINYSEYLAEKLDKSIDYGEYIAETLDKNINFSEYIAEHVDKNIKYSDYLAENIEKSIEYGEYIAENLDKNIAYSEYLAENLDNNIAYSEYVAEHVDNNIAYSEYIAEHVDNSIAYSEYIAENVSDTQAYSNYIAESLDKTINAIKDNKLNEELGSLKPTNVENYYDDEQQTDQVVDQSTAPATETPVQGEVAPAPATDETPVQGAVEPTQPIEDQTQPAGDVQAVDATEGPESVQGEEIEGDIKLGLPVSIGDKPGTVGAYMPENGIVVVTLTETGEVVETHRDNITILSDKILENENSIKEYVNRLITETKKLKASEEKEPHFLSFLTEKNKKLYYDLSAEDKGKINLSLNESTYYSEAEVLNIMNKTLNPTKPFEQILIENLPSELKPTWDSLNENVKTSIISKAKLFGNLDSEQKMKMFWESRKLENYKLITETKKVLNESNVIQDDKLEDKQLEFIIERLRNI